MMDLDTLYDRDTLRSAYRDLCRIFADAEDREAIRSRFTRRMGNGQVRVTLRDLAHGLYSDPAKRDAWLRLWHLA